MRRSIPFVAAVLVLAVLQLETPASTADPAENSVTHWTRIAEQFIPIGRPPASSEVLMGTVQAAIYDAVAATEGGLEPFMASVPAPAGASTDAAVATAAHDVLVARVPLQAIPITTEYDTFMGTIADGQAKTDGRDVGTAVADEILLLRADDGMGNVVPYVQPTPGPGVFEPVAPTTPVDVVLTQVQPFTFDSPWTFRPNGPTSLSSGEYAADFAEVKAYGRSDSAVRTPAQTQTVLFWAENTFVQLSRTVRLLAEERGLDLPESARLLAFVHVATADSMIACFDAKYYYSFWRPFHAIRRADTDGNPATTPDTTWNSFLVVNHPEYPSGHSCLTGAVTRALESYFGSDAIPLTITSTFAGAGPPRTYAQLSDIRAEVADARVWAGLHFRNSMQEGFKLARKVVKNASHDFIT
jgi:vanadium-dependent haloperoxidase-like protein